MNNPVDLAPDLLAFKKDWLPLERAIQRVAKFEHDFGKAHLSLACHAALASILTPELVNLIRINFLEKSVAWIAESDLLLSSLCTPIHQGIYEIEPQIRQVLLVALQKDLAYGTDRLEEIASFLYFYNESPLANKLPPHIKRTYRWISSAYLDPDVAVQNMVNFLENTDLEISASRTVNHQLVGKTLAILANPLEMSNLQVELDDLVDSTYLILQGYEGKADFSALLLQLNSYALDETTQPLTSSVVDWLLNPTSVTSDNITTMPIEAAIPFTDAKPITIFCSYAHKDEHSLRELEKYLIPLQREGLIIYWHNRMVPTATDWQQEIDKHLNLAQIILLLVSPDFLASDYCYSIEMQKALERHQANEARIIPILLRPVDWESTPFAHLQLLPTDNRPITIWDNRSKALADVATSIRLVVEELANQLVSTRIPKKPSQFPLFILPYRRNLFFTDREEVLSTLHHSFTSKQAAQTRILALTGMGGIGKTQIALEYAYRYSQQYQVILWLNASSREVLSKEVGTLTDHLTLPQKDQVEESLLFAAIQHWLQSQTAWLLILDQIENMSLIDLIVPSQSDGHVLLTTRTQATGTIALPINIMPLDLDMSALFLLRRAKIIPEAASLYQVPVEIVHQATAIAQEMGGLPLALDQAGAYLEETDCNLSNYLTLYQGQRAKLLQRRGHFAADHLDSVTTALSLVIERVTQKLAANLDLLRLLAFLHPDATIPTEMIELGASVLDGPLRALASDSLALDKTIATLLNFSLIRLDTDMTTISIHRLVQSVIMDALTSKQQHQWAGRVVRLVNHVFPNVRFDTWTTCERYRPQAQHCATLIANYQLSLKEGALLLERLGSYCYQQASYIEAETYLTQALHLYEQYQRDEPVEVAQTLNSLAQVYHRQARYQEAQAHYLRALELREQTLGFEHSQTAESLHNLAMFYSDQGQYQQAEQLYQRALSSMERAYGTDHPETARILNDLGLTYYLQGNYSQAEAAYHRTLTIYERTLPPNHPDLAYALEGLADVSKKQGNYPQAENLYRQALTLREQTLGQLHPDVAHDMTKLAGIYALQERHQQAEVLYQNALTIVEQSLGPDHPDIALILNNLAFLANEQRQYQKAEDLYQRALAIQEQVFGPNHSFIADTLHSLAVLYQGSDRYQQARSLYQREITIYEINLGLEHPQTQIARKNFADFLKIEGIDQKEAILANIDNQGQERLFDVFICYNAKDKDEVKAIAEQLRAQGIVPWLDEWELSPGSPWQNILEEQIRKINSAAVFIGKSGGSPQQNTELYSIIQEFVIRSCPVIPVLLKTVPSSFNLPPYLANFVWVDFRKQESDAIKQLIWGITGKKSDNPDQQMASQSLAAQTSIRPGTLASPKIAGTMQQLSKAGRTLREIEEALKPQVTEAIINWVKEHMSYKDITAYPNSKIHDIVLTEPNEHQVGINVKIEFNFRDIVRETNYLISYFGQAVNNFTSFILFIIYINESNGIQAADLAKRTKLRSDIPNNAGLYSRDAAELYLPKNVSLVIGYVYEDNFVFVNSFPFQGQFGIFEKKGQQGM